MHGTEASLVYDFKFSCVGAYGPRKLFLFTFSYGLPQPSMEPTLGRLSPTFLVEMRYPILPDMWFAQAPPSYLNEFSVAFWAIF